MASTIRETNARIDALAGEVSEIKSLVQALVSKTTPAKPARVTPVQVTPVRTPPTQAADGKVRRCKAPTADGTRCKVRSKGDICGLHRRAADLHEAKTTPAQVTPVKGKKGKKAKAAVQATPTRVTKGAQAAKAAEGGTLDRKAWNRTVTTKARFAGGGTYKAVLAAWTDVQAMRVEGLTPDQVIARLSK